MTNKYFQAMIYIDKERGRQETKSVLSQKSIFILLNIHIWSQKVLFQKSDQYYAPGRAIALFIFNG